MEPVEHYPSVHLYLHITHHKAIKIELDEKVI